MNGYVYVMLNPAFPHLVKVGRTTRSSNERAEELFSTGTPQKFIVAYDVLVDDCVEVELLVHQELEAYRYAENREFFEYNLSETIKCLERISRGRRIEFIDNRLIEEKVKFYVYAAFLGDGDQWMKWLSPRIKNKIYRFGVITVEEENDSNNIWEIASKELKNGLPPYYSHLGRIEQSKISLIECRYAGTTSKSIRDVAESIIRLWCKESFTKDEETFEIIYDKQTISYKKGEVHDYFKQLTYDVAVSVHEQISAYEERLREKAEANEQSKREMKAASLKGNF